MTKAQVLFIVITRTSSCFGGTKEEMALAIKVRWHDANVVSSHDATEQPKRYRAVKI